jgi:acyl-CoA thioester hydrolase
MLFVLCHNRHTFLKEGHLRCFRHGAKRADLLEQLGFGYDRIEEAGYSGPVLEVSCQYKTMSKFGETVRIEASITQYNGVRMTLHYDVYDKATGTLRCTGDSRHCFINAEGKPAILKRCWPEFDATLAANTVKE